MTSVITGYDVETGATGDDDDEIKSVQKVLGE